MTTELPIGSFCQTGSGGTPSREREAEFYAGSIPWVKSGELRENLVETTEESITELALRSSSAKLVPSGALLIAMYGATVGRIAMLGIEAATNQAVCYLVPDPKVADSRYLFHALQAKLQHFISRGVGGAQPNISQGIIKETTIRIPSLAEQRRIAAILDQAEGLRTKRRQALAKLHMLTQSIFEAMFGDESTIRSWPFRTVDEVIDGFEGGKSIVGDDEKAITPYRVLKVSAVGLMGFRSAESKPLPPDYVPPAAHIVRRHDLIFSRANTTELVGATAYVWDDPDPVVLPDKLWRFKWKAKSQVTPLFFHKVFQQNWLREEISRRATGTSGSMKNISQQKVFSIRIPVPPLEMQELFSKRAVAIRSELSRALASQRKIEDLFSSLQHRAFKGEL